ncbi:Gfo/Idh/MocA family protein [Spiroplasma eriocheiris]|nr:Gfo/Idh/MocA family oxidoreductase [Spiroplasma eriocheiris]
MLRFGIIGTGNIATEFIDAARQIKDIELSCLYSRSMEKAKIFSLKNSLQVRMTTTFEDMLDHIDAIYIASPNGLHYQQAKYFLQQQKHVF